MSEFSVIGKSIAMVDAAGKTTGAGKYTDDFSLPGMLVGKILHSPYPHALIKRIDTSRARALEGVVAVVTGEDAPNQYGILPVGHDETALAVGKVRYVGDNVACVAAVTRRNCRARAGVDRRRVRAAAGVLRSGRVDEGRARSHPREPAQQHREGLSPRFWRSGERVCRSGLCCRGALHRQRSDARGDGAALHAGAASRSIRTPASRDG